jgi:PAS domain S-box-containing protein
MDSQGQILQANDRFLALARLERDDLPTPLTSVVPALETLSGADLASRCLNRVARTAATRDGTRLSISFSRLTGVDHGLAGVVFEVNQGEPAAQGTDAGDSEYRTVYENIPLMYFTLRSDGTVLLVNSYGASELGYAPEELLGRSVLSVFHEEDRPAVKQQIRKAFEAVDRVMRWEFRKVRKDGQVIWVRESVRAIRTAAGQPILLVVCEDVTERLATERKLVEYSEKLRDMSEQSMLTEERERNRIAAVLHDQIGQSLSAARLRLGQIAAESEPELASQLEPIHALLQKSIEQTRTLTSELSAAVLKQFGLASAAEALGQRLSEDHGFEFTLQADDRSHRLPSKVETVLYLCIRELIFNVVKHANAQQVNISMSQTPSELRVCVVDDGKGFEEHAPKPTAGIGLFTVRERLEHLRGHLELDSQPGRGTQATLVVPI